MSHRLRSLGFGFVIGLSAILAAGQTYAAETTLRIGYILSASSQLGAGAAVLAEQLSRRTGGRYRIEQYPDSMLGGEVAMIRGVQSGALDLAFVTGASLSNVVPAEGVFDIPYLFRDAEQARRTLDGAIGDEYLAKFSDAGLVGLAWGENGVRQLTNSKRDVVSPTDVAGLRLRLPQSAAMVAGFQAMDASVRQVPFDQLYGVLQSGALDAQENPIATIVAAHLWQVQNHLTLTAHVYDPAVILMSRDIFDAMSPADRAAIKDAARLGGIASREAATHLGAVGLAELRGHGMAIIETVDRSAFAHAVASAEPTWNRLYGRDEIARIRSFDLGPAHAQGGAR